MIRLLIVAAVLLAALMGFVFADRTRAAEPVTRQPMIASHLSVADIRRALIPSPAVRKRIVRAHPHFPVFIEAKRRHGVSWFLLAAMHARNRSMTGASVMSAARRLKRAGAGSGLRLPALKALTAYYGGSPAARRIAAKVLLRAQTWKELGIIALPPTGGLVTPVHGVIPGCGHFHCPRPGHFHNGIDILAPTGTPIRAMQTGRVAVMRVHGGYGLLVCLQHSPRLGSCYAHLSSFAPALAVGRVVTRGQVVGRVGCTGACSGPHLHFEIRRGAASCSACAVDPVPYLEGDVDDVPHPDLRHPVPVARPVRPSPVPAAVAPVVRVPAGPAPATVVPTPAGPVPAPAAPAPEPDPEPAPPTGGAVADAPLPSKPSSAPGRMAPPPPTGGASAPAAP